MIAATVPTASVTVVVPTYREVENIPRLARRLQEVRAATGLDLQVIFMDDDSRDGSAEIVDSLGLPWVRLVTRTTNRGLSNAVLDGLRLATSDALVVMDADLSHPPEKIPRLLAALEQGWEIAIGSRFTEGGSTAGEWGPLRWLNSRVATWLAFPLTRVSDPMSGYFAMKRPTFEAGRDFDPIGYKILLELIVKCNLKRLIEIPIHFDDRRFGESKLSLREQLRYIQHLRRLFTHKYGTWSHLAQFLMVGLSGLLVNLAVLTCALRLNFSQNAAVALAIVVSLVWNFVLNRRFSFSYARDRSMARQFLGFLAACSVGALVNYFTTLALWETLRYKQIAAVIGVAAGTSFNFTASRFIIFRDKHLRK